MIREAFRQLHVHAVDLQAQRAAAGQGTPSSRFPAVRSDSRYRMTCRALAPLSPSAFSIHPVPPGRQEVKQDGCPQRIGGHRAPGSEHWYPEYTFLHGVFSFSLQKFDSLHNENSRFFRKSGAKQRTSSGKPADAIQAICQEII